MESPCYSLIRFTSNNRPFSRKDAKAQSFKAILGALGGFARE
jgi:hypothetical protein